MVHTRKNLIKKRLKSNKGITMQDLVGAVIIVLVLTGVIASAYLAIYKVQADTKADSAATLYMIQMMEGIDKMGYDEVTNDTAQLKVEALKKQFRVPDIFKVTLVVIPEKREEDLIKTIRLTFDFTFNNRERRFVIQKLKVKEI